MKLGILIFAIVLSACSYKTEIPTEFPTPEPPRSATPLPKEDLRRDNELEQQFAEIAKEAKGKVGVAAIVLGTGDAALLNANDHYPMQSVYKLPISLAVIDLIKQDKLGLEEQIGVKPDEFVRQGQASPLRDKNPNGGNFTIRELMRLALVESDGTASDVLMRVAGGPNEVQSYLSQIGIEDMRVVNTEKEMGADWNVQYQNWATPLEAAQLLRWFDYSWRDEQYVSPTNSDDEISGLHMIESFMTTAKTGPNRLRGLLPKEATVAHKTGTGGSRDGITSATNDIGIISLPNGNRLVIAVFVSDSPVDEKTREAVIARIAKAAWDKWTK
jgi:beta-lactamase class A